MVKEWNFINFINLSFDKKIGIYYHFSLHGRETVVNKQHYGKMLKIWPKSIFLNMLLFG